MAFLSSNGIASPTCAEKPGWRQARSIRASSSEMAWRSMRRASRRSCEGEPAIGFEGFAPTTTPPLPVTSHAPSLAGRKKEMPIGLPREVVGEIAMVHDGPRELPHRAARSDGFPDGPAFLPS